MSRRRGSRRRRRRGTSGWLVVFGTGAIAAGAAIARELGRRRAGGGGQQSGAPARTQGSASGGPSTAASSGLEQAAAPTSMPDPQPHQPAEEPGEPWQCECGQEYMVAGRDRHRIYWLAESGPSDPVLSGTCPRCDRPLPSDSGLATA